MGGYSVSMTLLLFDIDGTLVSTGLAGGDAMGRAFEEIHGVADAFAGIEMSGKTDPAILRRPGKPPASRRRSATCRPFTTATSAT